jgi:uncharacterized membrane protein YeiH
MAALTAIMLGTISAVGGGVTRDVLLNRLPVVLRAEVYATAAVAGATATVIGVYFGLRRSTAMTCGFFACFGLRVLSAWQDWNLPQAHG